MEDVTVANRANYQKRVAQACVERRSLRRASIRRAVSGAAASSVW